MAVNGEALKRKEQIQALRIRQWPAPDQEHQ